jgi:hypothetical protein
VGLEQALVDLPVVDRNRLLNADPDDLVAFDSELLRQLLRRQVIGHERSSLRRRKSPPVRSGRGSRTWTGWAAGELNGGLGPLPARREGYGDCVSAATLMEGLRPHFAKIGGVRLRWFEGGDGAPLALLHGLGGAASNWTLVAPALAERFRVLVPDLPGHGGSGGPPRGSDLGWQADALAELLRSRDAAGAAVVGHSMGGVVGLRRR